MVFCCCCLGFFGEGCFFVLLFGSWRILKIKTFHVKKSRFPVFLETLEDLAVLQAFACVCLHASVSTSHRCVFPRSTLSPGQSPGLSLEEFQGGLGGLMCRHALCERRSRTRRSWCQGSSLPRQLQFQQSGRPEKAVGPTPGSLVMWLDTGYRRV